MSSKRKSPPNKVEGEPLIIKNNLNQTYFPSQDMDLEVNGRISIKMHDSRSNSPVNSDGELEVTQPTQSAAFERLDNGEGGELNMIGKDNHSAIDNTLDTIKRQRIAFGDFPYNVS